MWRGAKGSPVNDVRKDAFRLGCPAGLSTPDRLRPASKDRFEALRALSSAPVLPSSRCRRAGKRAFEKPILRVRDGELDHVLAVRLVAAKHIARRLQLAEYFNRRDSKVAPAAVRRVGYDERSTKSTPAHASSAWMRRENAGCVTCRNSAEREKLRVSAKLTKSSSHLVSTKLSVSTGKPRPSADECAVAPPQLKGVYGAAMAGRFVTVNVRKFHPIQLHGACSCWRLKI